MNCNACNVTIWWIFFKRKTTMSEPSNSRKEEDQRPNRLITEMTGDLGDLGNVIMVLTLCCYYAVYCNNRIPTKKIKNEKTISFAKSNAIISFITILDRYIFTIFLVNGLRMDLIDLFNWHLQHYNSVQKTIHYNKLLFYLFQSPFDRMESALTDRIESALIWINTNFIPNIKYSIYFEQEMA